MAMAVHKITVPLDEALVRRARLEDVGGAGKSDEQVVEDALAVYLGLRALEDARAQGEPQRRRGRPPRGGRGQGCASRAQARA